MAIGTGGARSIISYACMRAYTGPTLLRNADHLFLLPHRLLRPAIAAHTRCRSTAMAGKQAVLPSAGVACGGRAKDKGMHAQLALTEVGGISGSDSFLPVENGEAQCIHVHLPAEEEARAVFFALSQDGAVLSALAANPPPDDGGVSGTLRDRYGFLWILSDARDRRIREVERP